MEPQVKFKGGGSFVAKQPKFSGDGQTVFVAWNNIIVSYNTKTAKRLKEYCGLWSPVAGFDLHYMDDVEYLTACSSSGEIISWKAEIGLRATKFEIPQKQIIVESFHHYDFNKFLISYKNKLEEFRVYFGMVNISNKKFRHIPLDIGKGNFHVAVCKNSFFTVARGRKLFFVPFKDTKRIFERKLDKGKFFTCVACHPDENCVITGDSLGRILVWYGFTNGDSPPAIFHWHTLPVQCLSFSESGTNFYSGAGECVLVKWQMDDPHWKNFLPRLPAAIKHITVSCQNLYIAVATADNAIRILDSRFETVNIIQHLVLGTEYPAGIVYNYRTASMILNGLVGHIQFYSPHDMTLLYNLDVVGQNKLTHERNSHIENTVVKKIALNSSALWLATVEERPDKEYSHELRLKFWFFDLVKQSYELNTSIELPHEDTINNILFQPSCIDNTELRCVTTGSDKKFKIWQLINADTVHKKTNAWTCTRVGFYRNLPCTALSFSSDGSLLAVGFKSTVTTWIPDTCELKCSLSHSTCKEPLMSLHFGIADQCHLIVAATCNQISVWNLLTLTMSWTVPLQVSLLVSNPLLSHMAVFTSNNKLFVFYPNSSKPIFVHQLDKRIGNVITAAFIPGSSKPDNNSNWCQGSRLYFINSKQEMFCFDVDDDTPESIDTLIESLSSGLFSSTVPKIKSSAVSKPQQPVRHLTELSSNNKQLKQLLDAPVHTMIPIRLTCGSILRSLIIERKLDDSEVR